jgi:hypothetical protein
MGPIITGLPAGWSNSDIGATGAAGSSTASGGVYTVKGSGAGVTGTSDAFQFAYQQLTGNGTIIARVTAAQATSGAALAGVMFRDTLAANARTASVMFTSAGAAVFGRRTTAGGTLATTTATAQAIPYWVKLVRSGSTFTAYRSTNGTTWTQVGAAATISMSSTVYVGLAVTSGKAGTLNTCTIDNVTVA